MKQIAFFFLLMGLTGIALPLHAQPRFTDVTASSGVANSSAAGGQQRLGTNLAWGDYNNDGALDLYVTNWANTVSQSFNRLYRNNADGSFSEVTQNAGVRDSSPRNSIAALWGDYDNDGALDLYVVNFSRQDRLYRNNGNGTFSNVTGSAGVNVITQGSETAAAWGDYDNDGDLDLYLCKYYFRNTFYNNNGDGSFSEVAQTDGVADIRDSEDATWGDYDNDGDLDLYVTNREQNNALYQNNGSRKFTEVACALSLDNTDVGRSARWIDYDTDGDLDLYVVNVGANALYRNDGSDQFVNIADGDLKTVTGAWVSWTSAWGDYDADGRPDLLVANGSEAASKQISPLLLNLGDGAFSNVTAASGLSADGSSAMSAGAGDYDNDGDLDLYILNSRFPGFEPSQLYRNDTPNSSTVKVRPHRKGAADGIGARVRLLQGTQIVGHQQIASGADALEAVFGVQSGLTYTVEVTFSDGAIATQSSGVTAGAIVEIEQP